MNPPLYSYWNGAAAPQTPYYPPTATPYAQQPGQGYYYDPAYYGGAAYQQYVAEEQKKAEEKKRQDKKRRRRKAKRKKRRALAERRRRMLNGDAAGGEEEYTTTDEESSGSETRPEGEGSEESAGSEEGEEDDALPPEDTPVTVVPSKSAHGKFVTAMSALILGYIYAQAGALRNTFRETHLNKHAPDWKTLAPAQQEVVVAAATPLANKTAIHWMQGVVTGAVAAPYSGFMTPQSLAAPLLPLAQAIPIEFMEALQYACSELHSTEQDLLEIPYNVSVGDNTTEFALPGTAPTAQPQRIALEGFMSDVIKDVFCGCNRVDGFAPPVLHFDAASGACSGDDLLFPVASNVASSRELFKFTIGKLVANRLHAYADMYMMHSRDVLARGAAYATQTFRGAAYQVSHELAHMVNQKIGSLKKQMHRVRKLQKKSGNALKTGVEYVAQQVSYNQYMQQQQQYAPPAAAPQPPAWNGASPSFSGQPQQPQQAPPPPPQQPYYGQAQAPFAPQPPYNPYQLQYATRRPDDAERRDKRKKKHKKHRRHGDRSSSSSLSTSGYSDD